MQLLKQNVGERLQDIGAMEDFLNKNSKAQTAKAKLNKWIISNSGPPVQQRKQSTEQRHSTEWGKIFVKYLFTKGLISKIYQQLQKLNYKKKKSVHVRMGTGSQKIVLERRNTHDQQA